MLPILAAVATAILASSAVAGERPDVVVVLTDDQGYGDLSCHGNPDLRTPNLDRLKEQSTSFERFLVSPTCAPTRAALLTGRHEFRVGVSHTIAGRSLLRPGVPTLAEVFRAAGYETAIFGKWHLGDARPCRPEDRGFGTVLVHGGGGIGQIPDAWGNRYQDPQLRTREGWERSEGYCTDIFFQRAIDWLGVEGAQPRLLWLATNVPHDPYEAPAGSSEALVAAGVREPLASFYAMIANLDENLGSLLEAIEGSNTIVVFLTDNGSALADWNAGMRGRKGEVHEGGVRVPCFIRWPGRIEAGRELAGLAGHVDLLPTLAGLCGVPVPAGWSGDGVDLSGSLLGDRALPGDRMFFTHRGRWPGGESPARHRTRHFSVRDPRWRLVGLELFDMEADPGETRNVFESNPAVVTRLLGGYGRWWEDVFAGLREPVRYQLGGGGVTRLSAHDWWPSMEFELPSALAYQRHLVDLLERLQKEDTRRGVTGRSGHWKLEVLEDGHYRVRFGLLPPEAGERDLLNLGRLRAGIAHLRAGRDELQLAVAENATAVTAGVDLAAGPVELEIWFDGQLEGDGVLGAFFAEVERVGPRRIPKLDFEVRPEGEN